MAALVALKILSGVFIPDEADESTKRPRPAQTPTSEGPPPTKWSQAYDISFFYSGQHLTVRKVTVRNLHRGRARVDYVIVVNVRGNGRWLGKSDSWRLGAPGSSAAPKRIRHRKVGVKHTVKLTFSWPTRRLYGGSALVMTIPNAKRTRAQVVRLALEVPRERNGIEEVSGDGGL